MYASSLVEDMCKKGKTPFNGLTTEGVGLTTHLNHFKAVSNLKFSFLNFFMNYLVRIGHLWFSQYYISFN